MTSAVLGDLGPLINEAMEEWQVPGLALAVVLDGEPALLNVYGQRDVEAGLPVTVDTQFILCSITKSFTAVGITEIRCRFGTAPAARYTRSHRGHRDAVPRQQSPATPRLRRRADRVYVCVRDDEIDVGSSRSCRSLRVGRQSNACRHEA
jgi:hypothetical protein